eukprot:CAMPEP_0171450044 /NCGR_PEP_ID=MMETSP0881-20121228/40425_1 /TAXON_ID=67004 /ORGANISM="Thalassiosira weissflogii, Strain CCMP1336" /LENGTH=657 /DNA_ID=CAMNT_0011974493 /DNA_START=6 /DNA_END=1979 /DNA_ORIENTATION=-
MKFFFASLTPATLSLWSNALHVAAEVSGTTARDIDLDHSGPKKRNRGNLRNHGIIKNDVSSQHARQIKVFHPYRLLRPEGALSWCRVNSCPPISATRPHCDTTTGMCVECLVDEHCHSLYGDKTLECVLDNVNSCRKKKHMAPIAMIRTESTIALSGTSSSSSVSSSVTSVSIQCVDDDECPSEKPICEDLSNGICFNPPCGYCKSETEISVTNPTLQANKSTTSTSFIQSSTASPTTIPTADSDIELASLWPNGDELADYASCSFDCCTNNDCDSMTDSDDRIIGGCCLEGTCQLKNSPDEICWDVIGPPADIICGYDAWMNYQNDGRCETKPVLSTTSTSHFSSTVSSSSIKSTPVIPTTNSGILWLNGDELEDYASCSFDCCTNDDCDSMTDSNDRIIGGCCLEGTCQLKNSPDEICWDVIGPPADIVCGYDAWMNYRNDGHCETKPVPTTTSTSHLSSTVSSSSIESTPVIPTTNSGILWPNGDELADYASCSFDCCTNDDCDSMTDSDDRIIGGCCLEGICQLKNSLDEICWDVIGPPADIVCGYDAWMNYRNDGHCEAQQVPTIPTTSSDPIKAQIPKTTTAQFVTTTLESKTDFVNTSELNKTPDYSSCEFSCCTKNDCKNMVDHLNRIVGGCCVEGYCQAKSNPQEQPR